MKTKLLKFLSTLFVGLTLSFCFVACNNNEDNSVSDYSAISSTKQSSDENTSSPTSASSNDNEEITSNSLSFKTLSVDGSNIYGSFSNHTSEFSFIDEIETTGNIKFIVTKDKYGSQSYLTKTVPLEVGDNTFYVFEILEEDIVNTYTVTLRRRPIYTVFFEGLDSRYNVEEGSTTSIPLDAPTKYSYAFIEWDFDFTQPITSNITINAKWSKLIYSIHYNLNGGTINSYDMNGEPIFPMLTSYIYGNTITLPTPIRYGYDFIGWYDGEKYVNEISNTTIGDIHLEAKWECPFFYIVNSENIDEHTDQLTNIKGYGSITGITDYGRLKYNKELEIPSRIDNIKITNIEENTFSELSTLTDIIIPSSINQIGANAFNGCSSLTNIYYGSTSNAWSKITIEIGNSNLENSKIYYYSSQPVTNEGNYWGDTTTITSSLAYARISELISIYEKYGRIGNSTSNSFHLDSEQMKAYISSHAVSEEYKSAVASKEKQEEIAALGYFEEQKYYASILLKDYELSLKTFKEELYSDFSISQTYFDLTTAPYNEWVDELSNDTFKFFLYEGYIVPEYNKIQGKVDKTKILKFDNADIANKYKTPEAAIERIFNDKITYEFNQILSYWNTASILMNLYQGELFSNSILEDYGSLHMNNRLIIWSP